MKDMWIDRDEAFMWFDVKPTYEALGTANSVPWMVSVQVSDEEYADYVKHCESTHHWQKRLEELYFSATIKDR